VVVRYIIYMNLKIVKREGRAGGVRERGRGDREVRRES
jgi:hypothetical protein